MFNPVPKSCRRCVLLIIATVAAGCSADEPERQSTDRFDTPPTAAATSPDTPDTESPVTVTVELYEWTARLSQDTVPAGEVVFRALNVGEAVHALAVEGNDVEEDTDRIRPGLNALLSLYLAPGTYRVYCPLDSNGTEHSDMGMSATLYVR